MTLPMLENIVVQYWKHGIQCWYISYDLPILVDITIYQYWNTNWVYQ